MVGRGAARAFGIAGAVVTDWSAVRVTAELTRRVVAWGVDHGWRVRREVPSNPLRRRHRHSRRTHAKRAID
ncbi:hypothetical protein KRM28CT15_19590 [Krasilnikovia sp. M28-CT-15]